MNRLSHLLSATVLALVLGGNLLSLAAALSAHRLDLLHHAGPQLLDVHLHALAAAVAAHLNGTLLATPALALLANDILLQHQLAHGALVQLLQRHAQLVDHVFAAALSGAAPSTTTERAAKEHVKDVHG